MLASPLLLPKSSTFKPLTVATRPNPPPSGVGGFTIECSSRPQKKATAHHRKTRPRKSQPWDIKRTPTVYPQLPELPPDWTLVSSAADVGDADSDAGAALETALASAS
ncbi:50S ribosomal protein 6, chloroplastic [Linum grandiflorum]